MSVCVGVAIAWQIITFEPIHLCACTKSVADLCKSDDDIRYFNILSVYLVYLLNELLFHKKSPKMERFTFMFIL